MPNDTNVQSVIGSFEVILELISPDGDIGSLHTEHYNVRTVHIHLARETCDVDKYARLSLSLSLSLSVCVCARVRACACACVTLLTEE